MLKQPSPHQAAVGVASAAPTVRCFSIGVGTAGSSSAITYMLPWRFNPSYLLQLPSCLTSCDGKRLRASPLRVVTSD